MAHKKAGGSSRNGRDSAGRRLGVKKYGGGECYPLGILSYAKGAQSGSQVKMLALEKITQSFL